MFQNTFRQSFHWTWPHYGRGYFHVIPPSSLIAQIIDIPMKSPSRNKRCPHPDQYHPSSVKAINFCRKTQKTPQIIENYTHVHIHPHAHQENCTWWKCPPKSTQKLMNFQRNKTNIESNIQGFLGTAPAIVCCYLGTCRWPVQWFLCHTPQPLQISRLPLKHTYPSTERKDISQERRK